MVKNCDRGHENAAKGHIFLYVDLPVGKYW